MTKIEPLTHPVWRLRAAKLVNVWPIEGLDAKAAKVLVKTTLGDPDEGLAINALAAAEDLGYLACTGKVWHLPVPDDQACEDSQASALA
jgi:hypothetical protein